MDSGDGPPSPRLPWLQPFPDDELPEPATTAQRANGQPAVAGYLQRPGTSVFRAQLIDVLRVEDGRIAEITTFEPHLFPAFGLPMTL